MPLTSKGFSSENWIDLQSCKRKATKFIAPFFLLRRVETDKEIVLKSLNRKPFAKVLLPNRIK